MTTKEQERKALAQMKEIVDSLGEGSYIAMAFDGCFNDAENNIEDDAAYSMKDRYESEHKKVSRLEKEIKEAKKAAKEAEERAANAESSVMSRELAASIHADYRRLAIEKRDELQAAKDELMKMIGFINDDEYAPYIKRIADLKNEVASCDAMIEKIGQYV